MLDQKFLSYIAGFIDGDGCIMAQLVRRKDYIYGYQIRTSIVFYQKSINRHHLEWIKSKLKVAYIRDRKDGMSEYTIVGFKEVNRILNLIQSYIMLKQELVKLVLEITKLKRPSLEELISYAKLVDQSAKFNFSKKRTNTSEILQKFLIAKGIYPRND